MPPVCVQGYVVVRVLPFEHAVAEFVGVFRTDTVSFRVPTAEENHTVFIHSRRRSDVEVLTVGNFYYRVRIRAFLACDERYFIHLGRPVRVYGHIRFAYRDRRFVLASVFAVRRVVPAR